MAEIKVIEGFEVDSRSWTVSDGNLTPTIRELIAGAERYAVPRLRLRVASWKTAAECRQMTEEQRAFLTERDRVALRMEIPRFVERVQRLVAAEEDLKNLQDAAQYFAETMPNYDNDLREWSDSEIIEEFSFWVAGSRLGPDDEGGPKQEWINIYWKDNAKGSEIFTRR